MDGKSIVLSGTVASGSGEGTYFMSMSYYQKKIKEKLGFRAYPGTLNLKVGKKQADALKNSGTVKISSYKANGKTLGGVSCCRAAIGNLRCAMIIPDLTRHKETIELIAPVHLKSELKLKDGDKITVKIFNSSKN